MGQFVVVLFAPANKIAFHSPGRSPQNRQILYDSSLEKKKKVEVSGGLRTAPCGGLWQMQGDGDGCHHDWTPECREILVVACAGGRFFLLHLPPGSDPNG